MSLEMEIDELGREMPEKAFFCEIPIRTKLNFLKKVGSPQEANIQDSCHHEEFEQGLCCECEWKCDHDDIEEWQCMVCGEAIEAFVDEDLLFEQWREHQYEKGEK